MRSNKLKEPLIKIIIGSLEFFAILFRHVKAKKLSLSCKKVWWTVQDFCGAVKKILNRMSLGLSLVSLIPDGRTLCHLCWVSLVLSATYKALCAERHNAECRYDKCRGTFYRNKKRSTVLSLPLNKGSLLDHSNILSS